MLRGIWDEPSHSENVYYGQICGADMFRKKWTLCVPDKRQKDLLLFYSSVFNNKSKAQVCDGVWGQNKTTS